MKQKYNKKYLKTNFISFIIVLVIFGSIGVYAAIVFPSNDVSYDNSVSGLKSTNVKDAIDELYTECTTTLAGEQIIEDAGLEKDQYECRYFFTGANPNNYITFNNEPADWRIISVECDGTIKIMKTASIGKQYWDTSGSNNWARPASLNTYLNGTYYNGLNSTAQSQIVAKDWSIGAVSNGNKELFVQVNDENGTKWNGKVALVTVSEYLRSNSNKSSCGSHGLNNDNYSSCKNTTWMYNSSISSWWMLSPRHGTSGTSFHVNLNGRVGGEYVVSYSNLAVRPVVYLSSNVKITGGTGTKENPYTIE